MMANEMSGWARRSLGTEVEYYFFLRPQLGNKINSEQEQVEVFILAVY